MVQVGQPALFGGYDVSGHVFDQSQNATLWSRIGAIFDDVEILTERAGEIP